MGSAPLETTTAATAGLDYRETTFTFDPVYPRAVMNTYYSDIRSQSHE